MAITKTTELFKIDSSPSTGAISVRVDTIMTEDGVEISRIPHRHAITPFYSSRQSDGSWIHTPTDISGEDDKVKAIAETIWTDEIKDKWKATIEEMP